MSPLFTILIIVLAKLNTLTSVCVFGILGWESQGEKLKLSFMG